MRPANTVPPIRPILRPFLVPIACARAIVNDYAPTSPNLPDHRSAPAMAWWRVFDEGSGGILDPWSSQGIVHIKLEVDFKVQ